MAVLGIVVLLLLVVGLLSMTATKSTILETKMVFNLQDKQRSLTAADSVAQFAWKEASANLDVKVKDIVNNANHAGYYVLGDQISSDDKIGTDWKPLRAWVPGLGRRVPSVLRWQKKLAVLRTP